MYVSILAYTGKYICARRSNPLNPYIGSNGDIPRPPEFMNVQFSRPLVHVILFVNHRVLPRLTVHRVHSASCTQCIVTQCIVYTVHRLHTHRTLFTHKKKTNKFNSVQRRIHLLCRASTIYTNTISLSRTKGIDLGNVCITCHAWRTHWSSSYLISAA